MSRKRLYRSKRDRMLAGVCGGLGEYLGVDPTVVRLVWVFLAFGVGVGVLAYIICIVIIPEKY
ncbi:MAG: PspC domain-containing protein [Bacillota bacterium]